MTTTALSLIAIATATVLALPALAVGGDSRVGSTGCSWVRVASNGPTDIYEQVCRQQR